MNNIILFGAGEIGKTAACLCRMENRKVQNFVDNDPEKQNKYILGIPVIDLAAYLSMNFSETDLILCLNESNREQVEAQLKSKGIKDFQVFDGKHNYQRERIISYTNPKNLEDVILYHVLRNEKEIFYIDIGSNDPFGGSVTKLLYDTKNAHGINVEPQEHLIKYSNVERPRDINLCVAVGSEKKTERFFHQGALSTFVKQNVRSDGCTAEELEITTLKDICDSYIKREINISFLKVDVEGYEREVLLGADFNQYRPNIIVMESTEPCTVIPNYEKWEKILITNGYHYVFSHGVNRYYVADERSDLDEEFVGGIEYYRFLYDIYHVKFQRI